MIPEISQLEMQDLKSVKGLYSSVTAYLQRSGVQQWDRFYPNPIIIRNDLKHQHLFGIKQDGRVIAAVVIDDRQSTRYQSVNWMDIAGPTACIHRLAVHPEHQGKGLGKKLLQFAEAYITSQGYASIRLDVFSENEASLAMYKRGGYKEVGVVRYPFRRAPYFCFEKLL